MARPGEGTCALVSGGKGRWCAGLELVAARSTGAVYRTRGLLPSSPRGHLHGDALLRQASELPRSNRQRAPRLNEQSLNTSRCSARVLEHASAIAAQLLELCTPAWKEAGAFGDGAFRLGHSCGQQHCTHTHAGTYTCPSLVQSPHSAYAPAPCHTAPITLLLDPAPSAYAGLRTRLRLWKLNNSKVAIGSTAHNEITLPSGNVSVGLVMEQYRWPDVLRSGPQSLS